MLLVSPLPAFAQGCDVTDFLSLAGCLVDLLNFFVPFLIGIGLMLFFWGLAKFILAQSAGDQQGISGGRQLMIWGIVALFVMVSIWGIVQILANTFGWTFGVPQLPT